MPNHVTNIITFSGDEEQISRVLESIKNDEYGLGTISFNKIIPMPESLNMEAGSIENHSINLYLSAINPMNDVYPGTEKMSGDEFVSLWKRLKRNVRFSPEALIPLNEADSRTMPGKSVDVMLAMGKAYVDNLLKYGAATWYDWRIENWDTKWDAYGFDKDHEYDGSGVIRFCTAWAAPHKVIGKLSEMFPEMEVEHKWADEDIGHNCGRHIYQGGERIEEYYPESEKDRIIFASDVIGFDPAEYGAAEEVGMEEN